MENSNKKIFIVIFVIIVTIIMVYTICNFFINNNNNVDLDEELMVNKNSNNNNNYANEPIEIESEKIVVYIIGCVRTPGIVELKVDARVSDAVNAAGGLLEDADLSKINLAYKLEDGQKITIPSINEKSDRDYQDYISSEPGDMISQVQFNGESKKKVNINSANQTELETLPRNWTVNCSKDN